MQLRMRGKAIVKRIFFLLFFLLNIASFCLAEVRVLSELTQERMVEIGQNYQDKIDLINFGQNSCQVKIFQTDYLFYSNGKNIYGEPGNVPRSNAKWLSLNQNQVTISPQKTSSVYYTLQVPENQALRGTYWSMIMVEEMQETSPEIINQENKDIEMGLKIIMRYGIQIITNIGNTGTRKIKFLDKKIISQEGKKFFQIDIENTGERKLNPFVWMELFNEYGLSTGRFKSGRLRIFPDCSVRHSIDLTEVNKGRYKALVVVDNGDEYVFGAQYDLGT